MGRETSVADRTEAIDAAFEEAPRAELPATVQQIVMDERPRGAISVNVKRDEREIFAKIKVIATAAGDDFFYSWPTKNKDGTKGVVEGPSVKCANAVARLFGNCSVKVRVFDMGANWIFYAQFYDMETGFVLERPFQQRKGQNVGGGMDKDRAADIVFQIGTSKAARNVVCNALSEFTDFAFAVAKEQLVEKIGRNLPKFVQQVKDRLVELKVEITRVEAVRGKAASTWLAPDVAKVIAEIQAVNDGMAHPDEIWPTAGAAAGAPKPQPGDFQADGPTAGKTVGAAAAAASQAETPAPAAAEGAKKEGPPAASSEAVAAGGAAAVGAGGENAPKPAAEEQKPKESAAALPVEAGAGDGGGEDPAEAAMAKAETLLGFAVGNLVNLATPDEVDAQQGTVVEVLKDVEGLDAEDLGVLMNRWKTALLERKRDLAKKGRGRR